MAERPLSFCMVTTFYPPYHFGGEAMYLYHLTNELARRGHEVTVVHCVDSFNVLTSAPPRGDFPAAGERDASSACTARSGRSRRS